MVYLDGDLKIQRIGTGRFSLPDSLNDFITKSVLSITEISNNSEQKGLLNLILPFEEGLEIKSIDINEDQLVILVSLEASLF
jgi:hypothetical protein